MKCLLAGPCVDYVHLTESWRRIRGPGTGAGNWHCDNQLKVRFNQLKVSMDYPHRTGNYSLPMLYLHIALLCFKIIIHICRRSGTDLKERLAPSLLMRGLDQAGRWHPQIKISSEIFAFFWELTSRHSVLLQDLLLGRITGVWHQQSGLAGRQTSNFGWGHRQQVIKINNVLNSFVKPTPF